MYTPIHLIRRYPISSFALLACLFGWLPYELAAFGLGSNPENLPLPYPTDSCETGKPV